MSPGLGQAGLELRQAAGELPALCTGTCRQAAAREASIDSAERRRLKVRPPTKHRAADTEAAALTEEVEVEMLRWTGKAGFLTFHSSKLEGLQEKTKRGSPHPPFPPFPAPQTL